MPDESIILRGVATLYKHPRPSRMACWPTSAQARNHAHKLLLRSHTTHLFIALIPMTQLAAAEFLLGATARKR